MKQHFFCENIRTKKDRLTVFFRGWKMGLEPTTPGTTIQCSNQLSYIHHV